VTLADVLAWLEVSRACAASYVASFVPDLPAPGGDVLP